MHIAYCIRCRCSIPNIPNKTLYLSLYNRDNIILYVIIQNLFSLKYKNENENENENFTTTTLSPGAQYFNWL
ncbi:hypothetical protein AQUCO_04000015v1 [Aquilegia coerulea]|uniref:Uncharacterized protein n=1 Tax=Aquilegia coerulea TaxID=218851 RepID=A0A2G5CQR2_AQUCA|nr:hypothetical protein AQUCO_04000015v1 [Aquilegia coerulea]